MIKIKDTIFNENEIVYIMEYSEKELQVMFKDNNDIYVEATFEDIEWNYDKEVVRKALDNDIDLRIKIQEIEEKNKTFEDYNKDLNNQLDKLEEENKRLSKNQRYYKDGIFSLEYDKETMSDMIDYYKSRIVKAIEYIKESQNYVLTKNVYVSGNDLLEILKGEENESN